MKNIIVQKREHGSVLVVTLLVSVIIGVTLASYLIMTQQQNAAVARSQVWNSSISVTEAGVEDALALLNKYSGDYDRLTNWCSGTSLAQDNWTVLSANVYTTHRILGSNYYDVFITNINNAPIISCLGSVNWNFAYHTPQTLLAAAGVNQPGASTLARRVEVKTKFDPLFAVAMAAIQTIDMKGNNVTTDSFDSASTNHSINGLYPSGYPSMVKSNGDICSDATIVNSINVGNANIKGSARTGPKGTVYVGPQGYVTGGTFDDFNVVFPDVVLPTTSWVSPYQYSSGTNVGGYIYNYVFNTSGDYTIPGDFSNGILVNTNSHVRLRITTSVTVMNLANDLIRIAPGGSLTIYMVGQQFKIAGKGVVNDAGNAAAFTLYGTTNFTDLQFNGNASFTGSIYAPQATYTLGGGGNNTIDFIGASITKTVTMNGHFNFHYDENLRRVGAGRGYIATSWKEQ